MFPTNKFNDHNRKRINETNESVSKKIKLENEFIQKVQSQPGVQGKLVLIHQKNDVWSTVLQSAAKAEGFKFEIINPNINAPQFYELRIQDEVIASGEFENFSIARKELSQLSIKNLQYTCFSILKKQTATEIEKTEVTPEVFEKCLETSKEKVNEGSEAVQNSIGAHMMRKMGWSGGGLGLEEKGEKNLVMPSSHVGRQGLGKVLPNEISDLIKEYSSKDSIDALAFSDKFSKEQRGFMHQLAGKYNLKSQSYGKGEKRMLVIKKKLRPWYIVHYLLENGNETADYKLILPLNEEEDDS